MRFLVLMLALTSCAGLQPVPVTIPDTQRVEVEPLPEDPEKKDYGFKDGDWSVPMDEEECIDKNGDPIAGAPVPCPGKGGVLMSEEKTAKLKGFQLSYRQLRLSYESDRKVWGAQRGLYEGRLKDAGETIQRQRPNWFQQHAFELGILTGVIVGAGAAVGIVYGVAPAFKQQTSTPQMTGWGF